MRFVRAFLFLFFLSNSLYSQILTGCVKDAVTGDELANVSIYFSGTSIGVISGMNGCFTITYRRELNAPLVFSILGYEKLVIDSPLEVDLTMLQLTPKVDGLDAVYLNPDPWTREEKERWFKKLFLGEIPEASECTIQNLSEVRLRFNPQTGLLTAVSDVPIVIHNKHLGYKILYDLQEFEVVFQPITFQGTVKIDGKPITETKYRHMSSFLGGSSFFKELEDKGLSEKRRARRRQAMYEKSVLSFIRSLINENTEKDKYLLFHKGFVVDIKSHIRVRKNGTDFFIEFRHDKYSLTDERKLQSELILVEQRIAVDQYGNNLSPRAILFGGYFAIQQIAGLLPLEYGLETP